MFDKPLRGRTRPVAPPLTEREAATVARFDNAPDADESLRRCVMAALVAVLDRHDDGAFTVNDLADAAIRAMRGDRP